MPDKPSIKQRVSVQILPSTDATEEVELDYRMLITGNFSGREEDDEHKEGELKDRKIKEVKNRKGFQEALKEINPKLSLTVENKITGEKDDVLPIELEFKSMKDFHPDEIALNVDPVKELLQARTRLKQMKMQVFRDAKLKREVENALQEGKLDDLLGKLKTTDEGENKGDV